MEKYDRSIRMYDEGEVPEVLEQALRERRVNTRKFLSFAHAESYMLQMRTIAGLNDVKSVFELGPGEHYCAQHGAYRVSVRHYGF